MSAHTCSTCKHFTAKPVKKAYLDGECSFPSLNDNVKSTWTGCRHHSAIFGGDHVKSQEMTEPMFANIPMTNHSTKPLRRLRHALWAISNPRAQTLNEKFNREVNNTKSQLKARAVIASLKQCV